MERPSRLEEVLALSNEQRAELRKECHSRVASAARNSDPPNGDDLLVLDWLDIVFDEGAFEIKETSSAQVQAAVPTDQVVAPLDSK